MCMTTGAGIAMKRAFSGVTPPPVAPPARLDRRTTPAITGTKLSIKSELSSFQDGRGDGDMANGRDRR
jgi:hypothetical protein